MVDTTALMSDVTNATSSQRAAGNDLLSGIRKQNADYLQRYGGAINGQEKIGDMYTRLGAQYNLPALTQNATNLQQSLYKVPLVQTNAARGNEMSQNQLDRAIQYQQTKLAPAAQLATQNAQTAQGLVSNQMSMEQAQQNKELLPYQTEATLMGNEQGYGVNLFTQENANELNGLLAKMQAGITLSEGEKNRANQLAIAEMQSQTSKDIAAMGQTKQSNPYISVGSGSKLFNVSTGQFIDTPSSGGGSATTNYYSTPTTTKQYGTGSGSFYGTGWK